MSREELMDQLKSVKAITPTGLAIQFNIKVSRTKNLRRSSRSQNLKVYNLNMQNSPPFKRAPPVPSASESESKVQIRALA
jgi:hypothetical protein